MRPSDSRLLHHLVWVIVLKLVVLTAIWWAFVRSERVAVGPQQAAAHIVAPAPAEGER